MKRRYKRWKFLRYKGKTFGNLTFDDSFSGEFSVFNRLSKKDQLYVSVDGELNETVDLISRIVAFDKEVPVAFVEIEEWTMEGSGLLTCAVLKGYRGTGLIDYLVYKAIKKAKRYKGYRVDKIVWFCEDSNIVSKMVAMRNGFKFFKIEENGSVGFLLKI